MPGGASCPAFVPASLVDGLQRNRASVDVLVAVLNGTAGTLVSSVLFASLGVPVAALSGCLSILSNGCDASETLQQQARAAAYGARVAAVASGLGGTLAAFSLIGAPAALALAGISATCVALTPVLEALGDGRTPKASDVTSALNGMLALARVELPQVRQAGTMIDDAIASIGQNPALSSAATQLRSLASRIPMSARTNPAAVEAANAAALLRFVGQTLSTPGPWPSTATPGTSGKFSLQRASFIRQWVQAGRPVGADAVAAVWRAHPPSLVPVSQLSAVLDGPGLSGASLLARNRATVLQPSEVLTSSKSFSSSSSSSSTALLVGSVVAAAALVVAVVALSSKKKKKKGGRS